MTIVGERLKEAMGRSDMDQATLALRAGCTQGAISQILLGKTRQSRFLPKIASVLGVPVRWLMGEIDEVGEDETNFVPRPTQQVALMVNLPSEQALAAMFEGLLAIVPDGASRAEAARILARRLPSGFAAIGPLASDPPLASVHESDEVAQSLAKDHPVRAPRSRN